MKKAVVMLLCCLTLATGVVGAAEDLSTSPRWSFEFKGGRFQPALSDWDRYYGSDAMRQYVAALGYMPLRALQLAGELGYSHDHGQGTLPTSGALGGEVNYTLMPVHVYALVRGVFTKGQWLVPYVGGGWTYLYYDQEVVNQQESKGHADGWNARAGLQLLLNPLDPNSAEDIRHSLGVQYTYLTLEVQKFSAKVDGTDLGGKSYLLGLRLEY
jgi:hypothetical protein